MAHDRIIVTAFNEPDVVDGVLAIRRDADVAAGVGGPPAEGVPNSASGGAARAYLLVPESRASGATVVLAGFIGVCPGCKEVSKCGAGRCTKCGTPSKPGPSIRGSEPGI